ncbi:MAG: hypothetical protein ACPGSD_17290, partial [Flavobacteriales bacterium]
SPLGETQTYRSLADSSLVNKRLERLERENPSLKEKKDDDDFFKNSYDVALKKTENIMSKNVFENIENLQQSIMNSDVTNSVSNVILDKMQEYTSKLKTEIENIPSKK